MEGLLACCPNEHRVNPTHRPDALLLHARHTPRRLMHRVILAFLRADGGCRYSPMLQSLSR